MLNCQSFQPFDVLSFPYEFDGDPERVLKFWIVARNVPEAEVVICFKPTTQTRHYATPERMAGVVECKPGEVSIFTQRTLVDPRSFKIPYSHLRSCYLTGKLETVGRLPDDFRDRIKLAAARKVEWRKRDRDYFLTWFE